MKQEGLARIYHKLSENSNDLSCDLHRESILPCQGDNDLEPIFNDSHITSCSTLPRFCEQYGLETLHNFICLQKLVFIFVFLISLGLSVNLMAHTEEKQQISLKMQTFFSKPLHEVASLGAPTTGSLVEGSVGSIPKGCRHRFYCHSNGPTTSFLGPEEMIKPTIALKNQPGIFPAPLAGEASISFQFHCQNATNSIIPVVIKPDGTVYQGLAMTEHNSPQTLVISSPAQTGIYTLFVLAHHPDSSNAIISIDAAISTQPHNHSTFHLKPFEANDKETDLLSAEFIYTRSI